MHGAEKFRKSRKQDLQLLTSASVVARDLIGRLQLRERSEPARNEASSVGGHGGLPPWRIPVGVGGPEF